MSSIYTFLRVESRSMILHLGTFINQYFNVRIRINLPSGWGGVIINYEANNSAFVPNILPLR